MCPMNYEGTDQRRFKSDFNPNLTESFFEFGTLSRIFNREETTQLTKLNLVILFGFQSESSLLWLLF